VKLSVYVLHPTVSANQNSNANVQISLKHPPHPDVPLPAATVADTKSAQHGSK
jgi:hypothetical protein